MPRVFHPCPGLVSALTKKPVRHDVAMTGEITLKGRITAVDGIQEKLVAAAEAGISKVYIPKENKRDYESLPSEIKNLLQGCFRDVKLEVI